MQEAPESAQKSSVGPEGVYKVDPFKGKVSGYRDPERGVVMVRASISY